MWLCVNNAGVGDEHAHFFGVANCRQLQACELDSRLVVISMCT